MNVDYELCPLAPGMHAEVVAKLGAKSTSLPVLVYDGRVIEDSHEIIKWAESFSSNGRSLKPVDLAAAVAIESRLNDVLGVHVRRMYYSEALVQYPQTVLPIFAEGLPDEDARFVRESWEFITASMVERMDLGVEHGRESREIVLKQLDWLDALLADGRSYLVGGSFSRVDICAAALLAPLAPVPEHPTYSRLQLPPELARDINDWQQRPVSRYVASMYRQHRNG